ncbi:MAG: divergent polysaccharide deacetylase family protein [Chitinispirillaceae bacterium]|jgi:polysaccharide deacetylase 2 family uncharacterized protein YibQ|nr:divergent polysaccharide deacetylase family protein [Chitinispirillaceae bacterium]
MRITSIVAVVILLSIVGGAAYFYRAPLSTLYTRQVGILIGKKPVAAATGVSRSPIENNILDRVRLLEIADSTVIIRSTDTLIAIRATIPKGKPVEWILWHLSTAVEGTSYKVEDCFCPARGGRECQIRFTSIDAQERPVLLTVRWASRYFSTTAKIAIVISEFGFAADQTTIEYLKFPEPLTLALMPSRKQSSWTAQIASEYKKEIVILVPMEPAPARLPMSGSSTLMLHFPDEKVRSIIAGAAEAVPMHAGFCNLGGSRVLADSRIMNLLFSEIRKQHGYFLENPTSRQSLVSRFADRHAVPHASIDFKVDTMLSVTSIQELLRRVVIDAQNRGNIIISSRPTANFILALSRELPAMQQNGIRLSFVSDLLVPAGTKK